MLGVAGFKGMQFVVPLRILGAKNFAGVPPRRRRNGFLLISSTAVQETEVNAKMLFLRFGALLASGEPRGGHWAPAGGHGAPRGSQLGASWASVQGKSSQRLPLRNPGGQKTRGLEAPEFISPKGARRGISGGPLGGPVGGHCILLGGRGFKGGAFKTPLRILGAQGVRS